MKCPYYGSSCLECVGECMLDQRARDPISGRLIKIGRFKCACGEQIDTPVTPCRTNGCKHQKKVFKIESKVNGVSVRTIKLPDRTYQTTVIGGALSGETWANDTVTGAIDEHQTVLGMINLV